MEALNKWAAIISIIHFIVFYQESISFLQFVHSHDQILTDILYSSSLQLIGQIFIFYVIAHFGPVLLALITTTRKFFTVLYSIVYFNHSINSDQWICIVIVFLGVSIELYYSVFCSDKPKQEG